MAVRYHVNAWTGWAAVERGQRAHDCDYATREQAMAVRDALPYPIVDVIRHDDGLDGRNGGRVIADRRAVPHPAEIAP